MSDNKFLRQKKTTPNEDGFKVLVVGIICTIGILMFPHVTSRMLEHRWYRDLVRLTPFHSVELYYSYVTDGGNSIVFGGTLTKRRCDYNHLVGYVTGQYGQRHRVEVNTDAEDKRGVSGSRPPSDAPETWGPWSIDITNMKTMKEDLKPSDFEVIAFHVECPTEPTEQSNEFITAPWGDYEIELDPVVGFDETINIEEAE
jgi:hypothetical protein